MRVERVVTHLTCNQNCTYCTGRRAKDDPRFAAGAAARARISDAMARGAREIVITGGEPLMRRDATELVAHARSAGAERVVVETNATLVTARLAHELAAAGLTLARVNLAGAAEDLDRVTRDPGGFERTVAGLRAFAEAGVAFEIAVALVRSTQSLVVDLPERIAETLGDGATPKGFVLTVPVESPAAEELLSYEEAARIVVAFDRSARRAGIPARLAQDSGPPPCFLPRGAAHLFSLTPGADKREDRVRVDACEACLVRDRCGGIPAAYVARHSTHSAAPIVEDRVRRRLSVVRTVEEQIKREIVSRSLGTAPDGRAVEDHVVRVSFHCNQACTFCFVSTHLPAPPDSLVRASIEEAAAAGGRIVLSGGEPTLSPRLLDYVRLAKQKSSLPVELQTNAVRLESPELLAALVDAGLDHVFVSLHGASAEISDAVTCAPGTFVRTLAGLDNLARTSLRLIVNFVICRTNISDLGAVVELVAERWPRAWLNVSFVAPSTDLVPRDRSLVPSYAEALPALASAITRAAELGVQVMGFESMCGIPLCLVPGSLAARIAGSAIPEGYDAGEFVRGDACDGCALAKTCWGMRKGYAELYGTGELRRVEVGA